MATTYKYIARENSSSGGGSGEVEYFSQAFTTGSWAGPTSGYYSLTISQSSHGKTGNLTVTVFESSAGSFEEVETFVQVNASLDVSIRIDATTDTRFAGKVLIL